MRKDELKIWLVKRSNGIWVIRYNDPETRRSQQKSTRTNKKKEAERQLGELRADLLNNRFQPTNKISWSDFRRRYEDEHLPSLAHKTAHKIATVFNKIEEILCPQQLQDLTSDRLSYFQSELRDGSRTESTIAGYIAHLRAALNWAVGLGLLFKLPKITKPKRAKSGKMMKGRPITPEEFQTILDQVPSIVGEKSSASWSYLLNGLWWSGLRLSESLELFWDDQRKLCVTFECDDLMLRIPAELEKGNKDRLLPLAPEFIEFLLKTSNDERKGRVFTPQVIKMRGEQLTMDRVSRIISKIGKAAKVIVDKTTNKSASAQDFRRSFGERWAARVMPQALTELMRHESIETTMKYYVGQNAQRTAKLVREAYEREKKEKKTKNSNDNDTENG